MIHKLKYLLEKKSLSCPQEAELLQKIAQSLPTERITRIMSWHRNIPKGPINMQINPTNRCNLKCIYCWQREEHKVYTGEEVSDERYVRLIDEAAELGVRLITITGGGEPLCRKGMILKLIRKIKENGISGSIITNGTLIDNELASAFVEAGWDEIIFSIDSLDEETNDYLRGAKGTFSKCMGAIKAISALKAKKGQDTPIIGIHSALTTSNSEQIPDLIRLAYSIGVRKFTMTPVTNFCEDSTAVDSLKVKAGEEQEATAKALLEGHALCNNFGIDNNLHLIDNDILTNVNNKAEANIEEGEKHRNQNPAETAHSCRGPDSYFCYDPFTDIRITPDGKIGPCCMIAFDDRIHKKSLKEIWLGHSFEQAREAMRQRRPLDNCRNCISGQHVTNERMRELLRHQHRKEAMADEQAVIGRIMDVASNNAKAKAPYTLDVEISESCDSDGRARKILEDAIEAGVKRIRVSLAGDCAPSQGIIALLKEIKSQNPNITSELLAEGIHIQPALVRALSEAGLDRIIFTICGPTAELHDTMRKKGDFDKVYSAMKSIRAMELEKRPKVRIEMGINKLNYNHMDETVLLAKTLGADEMIFEPKSDMSFFGRISNLGKKEKKQIDASKARISLLAESEGIATNIGDFQSIPERKTGRKQGETGGYGQIAAAHCLEPWHRMRIGKDGSVLPQCMGSNRGANAFQDNTRIQEIWLGQAFSEAREMLIKGNRLPPSCRGCQFIQPSQNEKLRRLLCQGNPANNKGDNHKDNNNE